MKELYGYKLTIIYQGTAYHGWQIQPNGNTIQAELEKALYIILKEQLKVIGAGRTDSGVHALAQVAHFRSKSLVSLTKLQACLNGLLPLDIRILKVENVSLDFHAQHSACSKIYRYHIFQAKVLDPFKKDCVWQICYPLDLPLLKKASLELLGTHDFTSFTNEAFKGVAAYSAVRTIYRIEIVLEENGFYLEFEGNGFLYKMVRNLVGTLIDCARGKITKEDLKIILQAKDRKKASYAAPAKGLFLVNVKYNSF